MKKIIYPFSLILFFCSTTLSAQNNFLYKRELKGIQKSNQTEWYKIKLTSEIIEKTTIDFSDVRIFGVTNSDTVEAPFLTKKIIQKSESQEIDFKIINSSKKNNAYFFTLEKSTTIKQEEATNLIKLDFENTNFDWRVKLEGSQNQNEWFEIIDNYRIISIQNEFTAYEFTRLIFQNTKYKYYRIKIMDKSENQAESEFKNNAPILNSASVFLQKTIAGNFEGLEIISKNIEVNKEKKQTIIDVELAYSVPIDFISLEVKNDFEQKK